jgi:two-component sensor histidine kinase
MNPRARIIDVTIAEAASPRPTPNDQQSGAISPLKAYPRTATSSFFRKALRRSLTRGRVAFIMGLFGVAFIVTTFGYIALEQRGRLIQRNAEEIASNAFFMADHAARLFEVTDLTLRQTAALVEDESWYTIEPSRRLWEQINAIKEALPYIEDIWLNDSSGRLRLTSARFPTPASDASDRDAFREQSKSDKGLFVGEPITGRVTRQPTFMVSRRLEYPNATFRGIVSVTVALSYFDAYWAKLRLPKRSRVTLMRGGDGTILAQYPPPADRISFAANDKAAFQRAVAANPQSGTFLYDDSGIAREAAYHKVAELPLYIGISIPQDSYWNPWIAQTRLYGVFALIAFIALVALTTLAGWQFREQAANTRLLSDEVALRTGELQSETAALEVLNRTGTTLAGELEIDHIMRNVVDAAVELTGAQVGAFFYRASAIDDTDGSDDGFELYALSGTAQEAFCETSSLRDTSVFSPSLSMGKIVRSNDILAEADENQASPFRPMPAGRSPMRSYMAVPVVSRTGNINGVLVFGHERTRVFTERSERLMQGLAAQAAIALENGRLYQAAQYEIEERKQSQAQQSLLIRELHHRVKNTLATVQAVVGATARSTTNIDDFYEAFVGRIISLANTHSLLTEAVWQTASLREILEKELTPYYDDSGERIKIEGPMVELPSEAAVPIGMAVHELTTNAAKYGALSVDTGRVSVHWTSEPEGDSIRLKLTWIERNGPPVTAPTRQGFGSRLLHRVLTTQLNAHVEMDFDETGLRVSLAMVLRQGGFLNPVA